MKTSNKLAAREVGLFFGFTGVALLGFCIFYLYPIIRTVMLSFTDTRIGSEAFNWVGFKNYATAITQDVLFWKSLKQSFVFAFASGVISLSLSLYAAMLLNRKMFGIKAFRTIFLLPFIVPGFAVVALFKGVFHPSTGIVNRIIELLGIGNGEVIGWYTTSDTAMLTMILMSSWGFGVSMLTFLSALQNVPKSLYEVADLEGASRLRKFFSITFPVISPVFFFNVTLTCINGLKAFNMAFLLGGADGYPAQSTLLFPLYLRKLITTSPNAIGYASAVAWLFFIMLMALTATNFGLSKLYVNKDYE